MRIAICDDDPNQISLTASYIDRWAKINNVTVELCKFSNAEAFLFQWSSSIVFDMAFLDIHMGGMSGIELAETIRKLDTQLIIVFITGLKEYVFRGYEIRALHYLLKPVKEKDCSKCLDQAYETIRGRKTDTFLLPVDGQIRKFSYEEIIYFEVFSHYIDVNTSKGVFTYKKKISDLEKELPADRFIRCHRSCIVNLMYISSIEKNILTLDDGTCLTISGDRRRVTNEAFVKYHFKGQLSD